MRHDVAQRDGTVRTGRYFEVQVIVDVVVEVEFALLYELHYGSPGE